MCFSFPDVQLFRILKQDSSIQVSFWLHIIINCRTITENEATNPEDEVAPDGTAPFVTVANVIYFVYVISKDELYQDCLYITVHLVKPYLQYSQKVLGTTTKRIKSRSPLNFSILTMYRHRHPLYTNVAFTTKHSNLSRTVNFSAVACTSSKNQHCLGRGKKGIKVNSRLINCKFPEDFRRLL